MTRLGFFGDHGYECEHCAAPQWGEPEEPEVVQVVSWWEYGAALDALAEVE